MDKHRNYCAAVITSAAASFLMHPLCFKAKKLAVRCQCKSNRCIFQVGGSGSQDLEVRIIRSSGIPPAPLPRRGVSAAALGLCRCG